VTGNVDQFPSLPFLESYTKSAGTFWNQFQYSVKIYIPYLTKRDVDSTGYGHRHCHNPCGVKEENARRLDKREQAHPLKRDTSASISSRLSSQSDQSRSAKRNNDSRHEPPYHNVD
jgi:hypothetical protein